MKKLIMLVILIAVISNAQEKNKLMIDERSGKPMLLGICDRTAFADTNFSWWFDSEYENYEFSIATLDSIKCKLENITIKMVLGTWCSDSRREVPRFLRLMDETSVSEEKISLICVDRKKESPEGNVDELDIKYVPTFIIYKNNQEIGRIIESPGESLERDLKGIIYRK